MQFLKTLFWVFLAVLMVLFSISNWIVVPVKLSSTVYFDFKLPVLVIGAFLVGFLPTWAIFHARIWSLKRRLEGQATVHVANAPATIVRNPRASLDPDEPHEI